MLVIVLTANDTLPCTARRMPIQASECLNEDPRQLDNALSATLIPHGTLLCGSQTIRNAHLDASRPECRPRIGDPYGARYSLAILQDPGACQDPVHLHDNLVQLDTRLLHS